MGGAVGKWECSIGTNTINGDKEVEGDRITPTGDYYICTRNDKSAYHLSLGLSYPDKSDADRGLAQGIITQAQRDAIYSAIDNKGCPPWDTALGAYNDPWKLHKWSFHGRMYSCKQ